MRSFAFILVCCVLPFEEGSFEEPAPTRPPRFICNWSRVKVLSNFHAELWRSAEAL